MGHSLQSLPLKTEFSQGPQCPDDKPGRNRKKTSPDSQKSACQSHQFTVSSPNHPEIE